ncbi:MAG: hypothetical protein IPP51_03245 [Bacteroidetes bacterium]|nr:hypothetical protein [Bacteroidota bacterium]
MLYSVNTDTTLGPVLLPTMPYNQSPLSTSEYNTLVNWIANGAPNKDGFVKFSDNPQRRKIYICMQGCDKVAVMDAQTKVIMRYVDVGATAAIEAPHLVRVSPDGQYWYVVFIGGNVVQKFRATDDSFVSQVNIGTGDWNTIIFSPDGKTGFVSGTTIGLTTMLNLDNMTVKTSLTLDQPHGGFVSDDGKWLYLTAQGHGRSSRFRCNNRYIHYLYCNRNKATGVCGFYDEAENICNLHRRRA